MSGEEIFAQVCLGSSRIGTMSHAKLKRLIRYLVRRGETTGAAGAVWEEATAEAVKRFMKEGGND